MGPENYPIIYIYILWLYLKVQFYEKNIYTRVSRCVHIIKVLGPNFV